jgi:nucleotide-binding universal stress UspA family protein
MSKVLVALDNSPTGKTVLETACAFATLLEADAEALHVQRNGSRTAHHTAQAAAVPLRTVAGPVVDRLVEAGQAADVVALALGARGTQAARRALGSTAAAVATRLPKPVLVVPPNAEPASFRRVLVPLEGTPASSLAPRALLALTGPAELDLLALHIHEQDTIPAFTDQPQHEHHSWTHEFLQRYLPSHQGEVRLETRVGRSGELIPDMAEELGCDLIALGWLQQLSAGRAPVVRETLERSRVPVLLIPLQLAAALDAQLAAAL